MGKQLITLGGFTVVARPICQTNSGPNPGRLMGYRLTGPRGNQKVVLVDHATGQPDEHELTSLALWVEGINYTTNKIRSRRAVS